MGVHPCGAEGVPSSTPQGDSIGGNPSRAVGGWGQPPGRTEGGGFCFCLGNEMSHQKLHTVIYHQLEISSQTGRN